MALTARNLTTGYGLTPVSTGIDLSLEPGALTVLIGANGSGKSTLLRTLTGAQPPLAGSVMLDERPISAYSTRQMATRLSLVLTDRTGGGGLTVQELVAIGRHPYSGFLGHLSAEDREIVSRAIADVGLSHKASAKIASLSDGERQKAMIARAIAQATDIIVLDEPTSFLDVSSRFEIMKLLASMSHRGKTILLSTHDIAPAMAVADRVWAIPPRGNSAAPAVYHGSVQQLAASRALDTIYPGVRFDPASLDFRAI